MTMMMTLSLHGHGDPCESEGGRVHLQGLIWNQQTPNSFHPVQVVVLCHVVMVLAPPLSSAQWLAEVAKHTSDAWSFFPTVQLKRRVSSVL